MSSTIRVKFIKCDDMIYISHLDVQRLLQRAFRRADINLTYSQGYNPHPKMSYGNALSLGVESYGEYVDIEIEDDITPAEMMERINRQLPKGFQFVDAVELEGTEKALAANIDYGDYLFKIDLDDIVCGDDENDTADMKIITEDSIVKNLQELMSLESIMITKKNKKGKLVENDIRPMIKTLKLENFDGKIIEISAMISTGSRQNLNTNIFIPQLLKCLNIEVDPLDVDIIRKNLYFDIDGNLVAPL